MTSITIGFPTERPVHRSNNFVATDKFELRLAFAHNFQVQSAYTWSRCIHVSFGSQSGVDQTPTAVLWWRLPVGKGVSYVAKGIWIYMESTAHRYRSICDDSRGAGPVVRHQ